MSSYDPFRASPDSFGTLELPKMASPHPSSSYASSPPCENSDLEEAASPSQAYINPSQSPEPSSSSSLVVKLNRRNLQPRALTKSQLEMPPPNFNSSATSTLLVPDFSRTRYATPSPDEPPSKRARPTPGGSKKAARTRERSASLALDPNLPFPNGNATSSAFSSQASSSGTNGSSSAVGTGSGEDYIRWDGLVGRDGVTAEDVLVNYLTEGTNYSHYKSTKPVGKKQHAETVIQRISEAGVKNFDKGVDAVLSKIRNVQKTWNKADKEWNSTGNGMTNEDMDAEAEGLDKQEREFRIQNRNKRAAFLAKFAKRYPYYETLKPIFGCRTLNSPQLLLDSNHKDTTPIPQQLGLQDDDADEPLQDISLGYTTPIKQIRRGGHGPIADPDNNDFGGLPEGPDDIVINRFLMSKEAEELDEDELEEHIARMRANLQQVSPSNTASTSISAASTSRTTSAASRNPALQNAAQAKSRKKKNGGEGDAFQPIADYLAGGNELEERMWKASMAKDEERAATELRERQEDRRLQAEQLQKDRELAERRLQLEELKQKEEARIREAQLLATQKQSEQEIISAKAQAFQIYRAGGMGIKEACIAAGLPVPQ